MFTIDDARRYLLSLLPPGAEQLYDLIPLGDVFLLFDALGEVFKTYAFDLLNTLRQELFPSSAVQKLPDWETPLGIAKQAPALFGAIAQRQAAVVAKLRESGPCCDPVVQSIMGPLLGYFPTTPVQIVKTDRSALRLAHTYGFAQDVTLPAGQTTSLSIVVNDGGKVSKAGAQLNLVFSTADLRSYAVTLTAPDGKAKTWTGGWSTTPVTLFAPELAGSKIQGAWTLSIINGSAAPSTLFAGGVLFVEGIGPNQRTGGAVFEWGVYADPAHVGESGTPMDVPSILETLARIKHSVSPASLLLSVNPYPDTASGPNSAIPDMCIPV
jgi:hypothetical protein